jgi:hypothetical protein
VRVVSGSMAERLLGEHFSLKCFDCGFEFRYGVESPPPTEKAVCPNCGFATNADRRAVRRRGDRVLIDRAAFLFDSPKRFDLVAFPDPQQPVRRVVKRIVGLPGEQIAIRHGDLYVNGTLLRRSLAEFRRSAVLVHDNHFPPQPKQLFLPRWRPDDEPSGWKGAEIENGYAPLPRQSTDTTTPASDAEQPAVVRDSLHLESADWLSYHHWRCYANPFPRSAEAPVADNQGYNQGESRELLEVTDLVVEFKTALASGQQLAMRIHDGREWFLATLDGAKREATVLRGEHPLASAAIPAEVLTERATIEFGRIDRQIVLAVGGQELLRQPYEPADVAFQPVTDPIGIGGLQSELRVTDLRILRDVYYVDPWSVGQRWETPTVAGPGQYVVLGDNPAVSDDSRKWESPWLLERSILGRVIPLD